MRGRKVVYMIVSMDKYELPLAIADTMQELAEMTGVKRSTIASAISHAKKSGCRSRYVRVVID